MVTPLVAVSDNPCRVCCRLFSSALAPVLPAPVTPIASSLPPCMMPAVACVSVFPSLMLSLCLHPRAGSVLITALCLGRARISPFMAARLLSAPGRSCRLTACCLRLPCVPVAPGCPCRLQHPRAPEYPPAPVAPVVFFIALQLPLPPVVSSGFSSGSSILLCRAAARPSCLPAPVVPFMVALSASLLAACLLSVSVPWRSHSSPSSDRCPPLSSGALPCLLCLPCSSLPPILPASSSGSCIFVFVLQSWSSLPSV